MKKYLKSPWGMVQSCDEITPWLHSVDTPSHGGLKLDRKHNALIPEYARQKAGWYEEDCEWSIVFCILESKIRQDLSCGSELMNFITASLKEAKNTLANWYPDIYEQFYEVLLKEGESNRKDQLCWDIRNKHNYKAYCAIGMVNNVKVLLKKSREELPDTWFMISSDLYHDRYGKFGAAFTPDEVANFRKVNHP